MARKSKDAAQEPQGEQLPQRAPGLVVVINPYTVSLPWPPHYPRGGVGTVFFEDDPVLDTGPLPDDVVREFDVLRGSQQHKVGPAPEGAEVTPIRDPRLAAFYARLGYTRVPYSNVDAAPPPPPAPEIRKEPEEAIADTDLEVPARDDLTEA